MRRFPAYDARSHYTVWGDLPGLHPGVHLIAASALYAEGLFWMDQGAQGLRREFLLAQHALRRARDLAREPRWANDPAWQALVQDRLYASWVSQPLAEHRASA
ncbi:hypothetical protein IMZ29_05665 [Achromobacter sp. GG226]|uniref:hypothetical protein n=1 Tax=Verticiella alkaliphila TaxID=2779529 RepID=UPI001C0E1A85|nr:hypothetical protein [Verticiella sp. GG226]MBU4610045.1 hypothetical protein [Verticiella sp. GG226]